GSPMPDGLDTFFRASDLHLLRIELHVVGRVEFNAATHSRQCKIKDELVAPPYVFPLVHPGGRAGPAANQTIEREQGRAIAREQSIVNDQRIIALAIGPVEHAQQVCAPSAIDNTQRTLKVIVSPTISFSTCQQAIFRTRFERGKDRPQITQYEHVGIKTEKLRRFYNTRRTVEHRLDGWID